MIESAERSMSSSVVDQLDTEIRIAQARAIADAAGSDDVTYVEIKGAPHYLEGHRPEAMRLVADWIAARFP